MAEILTYKHLFKVHGGAIAASTLITDGSGVIRHVVWNGATTSGHKASLQQRDSDVIWQATTTVVTEGNTNVRDLNLNLNFDELYIDDLDSGELLIYYDRLTG